MLLFPTYMHCVSQNRTHASNIWLHQFTTFINYTLYNYMFFSVGRKGLELRFIKIPQFSHFGLFFPHKTPKTYLTVTSLYSQGVTLQNVSGYSMLQSKGQRSAFCQWSFSAQRWPNCCHMEMPVYIQNATMRCVRSGSMRAENASSHVTMCLFGVWPKAVGVNRHIAWCTSPYPRSGSVGWCLAEN